MNVIITPRTKTVSNRNFVDMLLMLKHGGIEAKNIVRKGEEFITCTIPSGKLGFAIAAATENRLKARSY